MDLNTAPKEALLRVPGLGVRNVKRVLMARRHARLRLADLARLRAPMAKLLPFIATLDHHLRAAGALDDRAHCARNSRRSRARPTCSDDWVSMRWCGGGAGLVVRRLPRRSRAALRAGIAPEHLDWQAGGQGGLLAASGGRARRARSAAGARRVRGVGGCVLCHRDPARHALLYRLLWRLAHGERHLLSVPTDADVRQAMQWAQDVRRDSHKMKAFVRFREVPGEHDRFIAWSEPAHHILERVAPFFARRFAGMRWAILTPEASALWDGEALRFGPGGAP